MYKLLPILLFTYGLAVTAEDIYDNSYALIIGIDKYENISNLDYAVEDAKSIKIMLLDKFQFSNDKITLLLNKDATYRKIKKSLSKITRQAGDNDRILIFFSGHGETISLPEGGAMGFLIPVDGEKDDLYATSLEMDELRKVTTLSKAKHILYLVDACYGGLAASNTKSLDISIPGFLEKITRDKSRQIITAGGRGEKVIEKAEWGHSAFTLNILRGLNDWTADTNWDGFITAEELGIFLKNRVTKDSDGQQTPVSGRFTSHEGEFVFINNNPSKIINNPPSNSIVLNQKIEQIKIDFQEFKKHGIIEIDGTPIYEYRDSLINELQLGEISGSDNNSFDNSSFNNIITELKKEIAFLKEKQSIISESELLERIASLEKELNKPVKFIQGCTDSKALNYNPKANLDDNSCFVLPPNSAHITLSEFNDRDSTLDVTLRLGIGSYGIKQLNFSTKGFKILEFISGEVIDKNYTIDSAIVDGINNYVIVSDINSTGLINPTYGERILFTAKIKPGIMIDEICLTDIYISNIPEGKISIVDCLLLPKKMRPWSWGNSLSLFDNGNGTWNVMFSSDGDIAGFQFSIDGASVISASRGMAGRAGFMVSVSNYVIGFSMSGDKIPAGEGVLTILELSGIPVGISGIVVSDPSGIQMDFRYEP